MTTPLSDDYPVLLGPVRVETRFVGAELLIRVFPDEWQVDKFEPLPTTAEIAAMDAYWAAVWRAGGVAAGEQAAWHELSTRIPPGRATWLLQGHQPANLADKPTNVPANTTVLVVSSTTPVAVNDRQPTVNYWTAIWQAHGDRARTRTAEIALLAAVGPARATGIKSRRPLGIDAAPTAPSDDVIVAFLVLPVPSQVAAQSWTTAAHARLLPDAFTFVGYVGGQQVFTKTGNPLPTSLAVSPDPGTADADQLQIDANGNLHVPADLLWLTDFGKAVTAGMGVRIGLTPQQQKDGIDRLVVYGLRQQSTPAQSATDLSDLLLRQLRSPAGLAVLPQGTPTNNSDQAPAGQTATAVSAAALRTAAASFDSDDWTSTSDGQLLAEFVGIDPAVLTGVPGADGTDHTDARAMNTALWPATWGYHLQTTLYPMFPDDLVAELRDFFLRNVSGRGPAPTMRIGRQPYGILPTTAFSRLTWPDAQAHRRVLNHVLATAGADWQTATAKVSHVDSAGDPHQVLLDILALHPTSAEYYQRYAQSVEDIFNRENLGANGSAVLPALDGLNMPQPIRALLTRLGYTGPDPALLRRLFIDSQHPLLAPLVDDRPLSETTPVRDYTADRQNYLAWLVQHGLTDLEAIRLETGFAGDVRPAALLYLLLRQAVILAWADAGRRLAIAAGSPNPPTTADPLFVHVKFAEPPSSLPSESRFRQLYSPDPVLTGSPQTLVREYIPTVAHGNPATAELAEQVQAIDLLSTLPTARLERVLAEHLDLATYRLDSWRLGLVTERLTEMRTNAARGVHIGSYGWLENIRPRKDLVPTPPLPADLATIFADPTPLMTDPSNEGYVHAPSPAHARTAAVLRAGYLANGSKDYPGSFAVNLSSERVRRALTVLDGLRQGQALGALLGYRLERDLHDSYAIAELDTFIPALRQQFPLRANKIPETQQSGPIEQVESYNVVDGLALARHLTRGGVSQTYPFGLEAALPPADPNQTAAISQAVVGLLDLHDALADLAVAEGTHQALLGNTERAAATLDAYAKEGFPGVPAVVQTPRSGTTLTHRFGVLFTPSLDPDHGVLLGHNNPRAQAEPAVNDWLPAVVPATISAKVTWTDPVSGLARAESVTQNDLGLQPIDLLWAVRPTGDPAQTDLDDRIIGAIVERFRPRPDAVLTVQHTQRVANSVTFFETSPLIASLRTLLTTARPLRPTDLTPAAGGTVDRSADQSIKLPKARPLAVQASLTAFQKDVSDYLADLTPMGRDDIIAGIDDLIGGYGDLVTTAGKFGMVRSGWAELVEWRRGVFAAVLAAVLVTSKRMQASLDAADAIIVQYNNLPRTATDEQRFALLQQAERLLTTTPTSPRPSTPTALRVQVASLRNEFNGKVTSLKNEARSSQNTLSGLLAEIGRIGSLAKYDRLGLDLSPFQDQIVTYGKDLLTRTTALAADIALRLKNVLPPLADYDKAVTGPDQVQAATEALKALLGEDVLVVPEFTPTDQVNSDWRKARQDSGRLVAHLVAAHDFPVDDWVHGIARVRDKMRHWENAVAMADALRGPGHGILGILDGWEEPAVTPVQFPYHAGDHWLAMEFADNKPITEDKLLFSAHYAAEPLLGTSDHCGLLLDEWTEVVPAVSETTSIAVHVDRPDSEPPQAMLLVAPPARTGSWHTDDLLAAVNETLDLAKARAVEPQHLDDTPYAQLLPATVMSATRQPVTIGTDLAIANLRRKATP
ncbi:hypothetical protein [Kutzneria chonburiensis]|uniref:Uncharacterized protein n=1 Tax=Kutzneria chonburiensis TaxID=1483604 RepID=A0ABV6MR02_9PSEU|nr:hypothetical protein [Kutzneria chonburiensis]